MEDNDVKLTSSADVQENKTKTISKEEKDTLEIENRTKIHLDRIEQEMRNGYREFEVDDKKYRIYLPTPGIEDKITDFKAKVIGELLRQSKYITKSQVMKELRDRGVWDDALERKITDMEQDISDFTKQIMIIQHSDTVNGDALYSLRDRRMKMMNARDEIVRGRDFLLSGTIEAKVEEAVLKYQIVLCATHEDQTPIWNSIDDFYNETNKKLVNRVTTEAGYFWQGWSEDLLKFALGGFSVIEGASGAGD